MCTLTYIPLQNNNFILTSNRDEKHERQFALSPIGYNINHINVAFPKDKQKGGTWIAMSENYFTLCLFNGALEPHIPLKSYKKSRGLVLLDFFNFNNINQFIINNDFKGIEPFTLVVIHYTNTIKLNQIIWNGKKVQLVQLNPSKHHIWSSVVLYNSDTRKLRRTMFEDFIAQNNEETFEENIIKFHQKEDLTNNKQNLLIKSETVSTVSITQIVKKNYETNMKYIDLKSDKISEFKIDLPQKNKIL